jgi:hypothetical protein
MGQPNIIVPLALVCTSDAVSGWAGLALDHPEFGSSVNLISTKGGGGQNADYAHYITDCPPGFEKVWHLYLYSTQRCRLKASRI